jgi:uncharacterized protein YeaC (DUF1315 family)
MSEVIEMENANALVLKLEAQQIDVRLREAGAKHNRRSMEIGWYGRLLKVKNLWPFLGYTTEVDDSGNEIQVPYTEKSYRIAIRIGRSTWYKMVALAESFKDLTAEQFMEMQIENAEALSECNEEVRYNPEMVKKAATLSEKDFAHELLVDQAHREKRPVEEMPDTLKIFLTHGQKKAVMQGLREWQEEHGMQNEGEAIEMLLAEYRGRISLVKYLSESITMLRKTINYCDSPDRWADVRRELQSLVTEMQEVLVRTVGDEEASVAA